MRVCVGGSGGGGMRVLVLNYYVRYMVPGVNCIPIEIARITVTPK